MTVQEILEGYLAKTLNMAPEALKSTLYKLDDEGNPTDETADGVLEKLAALDTERVKALKVATNPTALQDQYKRGIKEGRESLEKEAKQRHGIESDLVGLDLFDHIISVKAAPPELDEEKVKRHPLYLKNERESKAQIDATRAEYEGKIAEIENGFKRRQTLTTVQEKALAKLAELRPVLPSNPTVAQTQQKMFAEQFNAFDYELDASGNILVVKDGKRVENNHGHPVPFEELVAQTAATMFEFQKTEAKGNGANKGTVTGEAGGTSGGFKDEADFKQQYAKADRATQQELVKTWKAQQAGG